MQVLQFHTNLSASLATFLHWFSSCQALYIFLINTGLVIVYALESNWNLFDSRYNVIACAKHFVGDGGTEKGINEGNTISSYDELESIHMAPYLDCLCKGVSTVMVSYSSWNGCKLHAHRFLLTEILKGKLGFKVDNTFTVTIFLFSFLF